MTKAEAIKELKMMLTDNSNTGDMYNALKMAIEALSESKRDLSENTIYRQDAIDALDKHIDTFDSIDTNYLCGLRTAMSFLKEMPSAEVRTQMSSADCISRQDAIDVAKQHWYKPDIAGALAELPSAQPERKKGEWIHKPDIYLDEQTWECSECGEPWIFIEGTPSENNANYCPNCGSYNGEKDGES